jgi:cytosolic 5'-nucleotidase 3
VSNFFDDFKSFNNTSLCSAFRFDHCESLPPHFRQESLKLFKHYRPIEVDPHLPVSEKVEHMIEWWSKTGELLK